MSSDDRGWIVQHAKELLAACRGGDFSGLEELVSFAIISDGGRQYSEIGITEDELDRFFRSRSIVDCRQVLDTCRMTPPEPLRVKEVELDMEMWALNPEEIGSSEYEIRSFLMAEALELVARIRRGEVWEENAAQLAHYLQCDCLCSHITRGSLGMTTRDVAFFRVACLRRAMISAERCRLGRCKAISMVELRVAMRSCDLTQQEVGLTDYEMDQFVLSGIGDAVLRQD